MLQKEKKEIRQPMQKIENVADNFNDVVNRMKQSEKSEIRDEQLKAFTSVFQYFFIDRDEYDIIKEIF